MTGVTHGTRFSCAFTVTVMPNGITTVSPQVGFLPNDHVPAAPQFPFTDAVLVTARERDEYKNNSKMPATSLVPVLKTIQLNDKTRHLDLTKTILLKNG